MVQRVLSDYLANSKKPIVQSFAGLNLFMFFYLLVIFPFFIEAEQLFMVLCYFEEVVLWAGYLLSRKFPNRLSKSAYLIPMGKEERERYLKTGYGIRIALPGILHLVINIGMVAVGLAKPAEAAILAAIAICFWASCNMYMDTLYGKKPQQLGVLGIRGYTGWMMSGTALGIFNFLLFLFYMAADRSGGNALWETVLLSVSVFVQLAILLRTVYRYLGRMIEIGADYESLTIQE